MQMPFDWKEYLLLAQFLERSGNQNFSQEAALRSAVSRAYYAAFCHCRNFARDKQGFHPAYNAEDHQNLPLQLKFSGMYKEARTLDRLRKWRNECDYEDEISSLRLSHILTQSLARAHNLLKNI